MQAKLKLILTDAVQFFLENMPQIARLCLPWLLAAAFVEYGIASFYQSSEGSGSLFLLAIAFNFLVYPVYTACLILFMARRAQRQNPDNNDLTALAIKMWQPFFKLYMIKSILTLVGFMLFFGPGIWAAVRLSFSEFYLVLEGLSPKEAIQKSFHQTKPHFTLILILLVLFFTPFLLLNLFFGSVLYGYGPLLNIAGIALAFLKLFADVILFRVYMSATQVSLQAS